MAEPKTPIPQAADESALSDESLESVAGGRNIVISEPVILVSPPLVMPLEPILDPMGGLTPLPSIGGA